MNKGILLVILCLISLSLTLSVKPDHDRKVASIDLVRFPNSKWKSNIYCYYSLGFC